VNDKDEEDVCKVVALLDFTCREELFKFLPNYEVDVTSVNNFLSTRSGYLVPRQES
jgi:hypothetical protein